MLASSLPGCRISSAAFVARARAALPARSLVCCKVAPSQSVFEPFSFRLVRLFS